MASPFLTTLLEEKTPQPTNPREAEPKEDLLLVAGFGNPVAADYVAHLSRLGIRNVAIEQDVALRSTGEDNRIGTLVLFLPPGLSERDRRNLDDLLAPFGEGQGRVLCIVSTFRVHFGDRGAEEAEAYVLSRA